MALDFASIKAYVNTPEFAANAQSFGAVSMAAGLVGSFASTYFQMQSAKIQAQSDALNWQMKRETAEFNKRASERNMGFIDMAMKSQAGKVGLQAKAQKGAAKASYAGRGIDISSASAQEVARSIDIIKEEEYFNIQDNGMTAMQAQRLKALGFGNEAAQANLGAIGANASAALVNPFASAAGSLLSSAGKVAQQWIYPSRSTLTQPTIGSNANSNAQPFGFFSP